MIERLRGWLLLGCLGLSLPGESPFGILYRKTHPAFRIHTQGAAFPSNLVAALVLDPDGNVWAGTVAGLARYDGRGWHPVPGPIPDWRLWVNNTAMGVLEDGTLWCGTRSEGLLLHKHGRWRQLGLADGLPSLSINALLESRERGSDGRRVLYVGTYGKGLARLRDGRWTVLDERQGLASGRIFCLAEDPGGRLWVGTRNGVFVGEGGRFVPFEAQAQFIDPDIRQMAWIQGRDGIPELWIGPLRGGVYQWREGRLQRHPIVEKGVSCLMPGRAGGVWVTFWGGGLARWDGERWQTWGSEDGLPSAHLRCLLEVEEDGRYVLWIGSDGRGVFRTSEGGWRQWQPRWAGEQEVRSFAQSPEGKVWIGGRNFGLMEFDGEAWTRHPVPSVPVTGDVRSLAWWRGQVWAGCDIELARLGPRGLEPGAPGTILSGRSIRCVVAEAQRLWVGTSSGLILWDGTKAETLRIPGPPLAGSIRCVVPGEGEAWVGTDAGLFHRRGEGPFELLPGFEPGEAILALVKAKESLWVGTSSGRILRLGGGELQDPGSPGQRRAVQALLATGDGRHLYAGTTRGVEWWDLARGRLLRRFTEEDGLPEQECLPGALFQDPLGRIWAGTGRGAGVLDPAIQAGRPSPKALKLEGLASASGALAPGATLPRGESWLRVDFALRTYHREKDARYRTQLLPVEPAPGEWTPDGHRRLQSLPRGAYTLRVWARDYLGQVSGPLDVPFRVRGRLWEHPLFLGLGGVLLLAAGGLMARSRMKARERRLEAAVARATAELVTQKQHLEELARQQGEIMGILAHDIRNPLGGISLMAEMLEEEEEPAERISGLQRIRAAVGSVVSLLNQFLTMQSIETGSIDLNLEPVPLLGLGAKVAETFGPQAARKGQGIRVDGEDLWAVADAKVLTEVLANLVSNALKYSPPGTEVSLRVSRAGPGSARISVADQGPGLTAQDKARLFQRFSRLSAQPTGGEQSVGLGLSIAKRWMEAMGGAIGAEGEPGRGSTFWVELKEAARG